MFNLHVNIYMNINMNHNSPPLGALSHSVAGKSHSAEVSREQRFSTSYINLTTAGAARSWHTVWLNIHKLTNR